MLKAVNFALIRSLNDHILASVRGASIYEIRTQRDREVAERRQIKGGCVNVIVLNSAECRCRHHGKAVKKSKIGEDVICGSPLEREEASGGREEGGG